MSKICETCQYKDRLFCKEIKILQEDLDTLLKTKVLKEIHLKNSIKTKKGIDELYQILLSVKREGKYDALSFCNFPCLFCIDCSLNHHMKVGYTIISNRKIVKCIGILGMYPGTDETEAWILI